MPSKSPTGEVDRASTPRLVQSLTDLVRRINNKNRHDATELGPAGADARFGDGRSHLCPGSGDLVHLNFQPSAGREQTGPRYGIVLSGKSYNRASGLCVCCPITSHVKGYPFEVAVYGGRVKGVVLCDHVRSVDWRERAMQFAEKALPDVVQGVTDHVAVLIGAEFS